MKTQKNTLGTVALNDSAQGYLIKLASFLEAKAYSPMTIRNYMSEMRYIFAYYNHLNPEQLTQDQISHVIQSTANIKHKAIIALFYGTGIRLSELRFLEMKHISRTDMQIKVVAGKGSRDRFTILPAAVLPLLEAYYRVHKPKTFLFEGQTPGKAMNDRSIQHAIRMAMNQAGFEQYGFSAERYGKYVQGHLHGWAGKG